MVGWRVLDGSPTWRAPAMQSASLVCVACPPPESAGLFPALVGNAVIVSGRLVPDGLLTSSVSFRHRIECRETKLGPEEFTRDIPGLDPDALHCLDARGLVRVGATVRRGDLLVGKVTPISKSELTAEEKILHA